MKKKTKSTDLSAAEVKHVASLAKLVLTPKELEQYGSQLTEIIRYVNLLNEIDVSEVAPTSQVTNVVNVLREDTVTPSLDPDQVLMNAKRTYDGYFLVDAVLKEE